MYRVGQEYFSVKNNIIITVTKILKNHLGGVGRGDYVRVTGSRLLEHYIVSYSDMDRFIASGRLKPLDDFTPIKCLYNQPKIWQCDKDCVSL